MNSVLQSLYMTDQFRDLILQSPILSPSQVVLHRLQIVFSFLKYSYRSTYSPKSFYDTARPSWFDVGRQQDCSEFLKYLLDTLHEQEKSKTEEDNEDMKLMMSSNNALNSIQEMNTIDNDEALLQDTKQMPIMEIYCLTK